MKNMLTIGLLSAALLASPAFAGGSAEAGKAKSATCAACHGPDGYNTTSPTYPRLAGQHPDYLRHALEAYKTGKRKNAIMNGMAAGLSDQDMADLAAFFSGQKGLRTKY